MIPKIIHYCWFGGNPLPELAKKCINSWKEFFPDYKIKEWNENNYDISKIKYTMEAYNAKKYAFVSDYARFDILYQYGGVYFDTDVEVIKDMHYIIEKGAFIGIEKGDIPLVNAGLGIASPAENSIFKEILDSYKSESFIKSDGSYNLKTVVTRVSDILKNHGFIEKDYNQNIDNITIYSSDYFCPKDFYTSKILITENTCSIHHYDASWTSIYQKKYYNKKRILCNWGCFGKIILFFFFVEWQIKEKGIKYLSKKIINKIFHKTK